MPVKVIMPRLGDPAAEARVTRWLRSEGDPVDEFESLLEVDTGRVGSEIPCPTSGVLLKILVPAGSMVRPGGLLAWVGFAGEEMPDVSQAGNSDHSSPGDSGRIINLSADSAGLIAKPVFEVIGRTWPSPAGTKPDHADADGSASIRDNSDQATADQALQPDDEDAASQARMPDLPAPPHLSGDLLMPLSPPRRRAAAAHCLQNWRSVPLGFTLMDADLRFAAAHRESHKAFFLRDGADLTWNAYFISAAVNALKSHPTLNASWTDAGVRLHTQINMGVLLRHDEEGLLSPVIQGCDGLSLLGLARAWDDLTSRAAARRLHPGDMQEATFSYYNYGAENALIALPPLPGGQAAVLGAGVVGARPVIVGDAIAIRPLVTLTLTFDQRLVDLPTANAFLARVVDVLQTWN